MFNKNRKSDSFSKEEIEKNCHQNQFHVKSVDDLYDEIPVIDEDWQNLKLYKENRLMIESKFLKLKKIRMFMVPLVYVIFIVSIIFQSKNELNKNVSTRTLELYWQKLFMDGKSNSVYITNEALMQKIYDNIWTLMHLEDICFSKISVNEVSIFLTSYNINSNDKRSYFLSHRADFDQQNITSVLNLPINLHNSAEFKAFFNRFDTVVLSIKNLNLCIGISTEFCHQTDLKIRYVRFNFRFHVRISENVLKKNPTVKTENWLENKKNCFGTKLIENECSGFDDIEFGKPSSDFLLKKKIGSLNFVNQNFREKIVDNSSKSKFMGFVLLVVAFLGFSVDLKQIQNIRQNRDVRKHFELKLIIFEQERFFKQRLINESQKQLDFFILASIIKNFFLLYSSLCVVSPFLFQVSHKLNQTIELLVFVSVFEILSLNKDIGLIVPVLQNGFATFIKSFMGYLSIAVAFIFSTTLILNSSSYFSNYTSSFSTIFSLMTGDNILSVFNDLRVFGWMGSLILFSIVIFFVFILQSLYIMIITDSFMTQIEGTEIEKKTNEKQISFFSHENKTKYAQSERKKEQPILAHPEMPNEFREELNLEKLNSKNWNDEKVNDSYLQIDQTLPLNDTSSIYADSIESPEIFKKKNENEQFDPQNKKERYDEVSPNQNLENQKYLSNEEENVEMFNRTHQLVQAHHKSLINVEMEIFSKMKKLLTSSINVLTNFEKMYIKLCIEFVEANISKQKSKVITMRKNI